MSKPKESRRKSRSSHRTPDDRVESFLNSLEKRLTGRAPDKTAKDHRELQERFAEFTYQERLAWLSRPRLHTAIFEEAAQDEEIAKQGGRRSGAEARAREIREMVTNVNWSNDRLAAFKEFVVKYRREERIEHYLEIRRMFPEVDIQISRFSGIDPLFALEDVFKRQGVDPDLVASALDSDEPSIDALSLRLLELLANRDKLPKSGPKFIEQRRNAISDATINFLIVTMLEGFDWHDETGRVPGSLIVLIRRQLVGSSPDLYQAYLAHEKQHNAAFIAAQLLRPDEKVSVRRLAKVTGTSRSTAARWLADGAFVKSLESYRRWVASPDFREAIEKLEKKDHPT